jgi:hypothetical protein
MDDVANSAKASQNNGQKFFLFAVPVAIGALIYALTQISFGVGPGQGNGQKDGIVENAHNVAASVTPVTSQPEIKPTPAYQFSLKNNQIFHKDQIITWKDFLALLKEAKEQNMHVVFLFEENTITNGFKIRVNEMAEKVDVLVRQVTTRAR